VNNRGKIGYVFASSNTSQGFYTFIPDLINDLKKVYILKGAAGSGKSTFIRLLGESISEQGYEVEFWISATDGVSPDGVYIPQLQAAIVNGSLPQPIDPCYPAGREIIINLGEYWNKEKSNFNDKELSQLIENYQRHSDQAYSSLKNATRLKEGIKKVVSRHLNLEKIDQLVQDLSAEIMENHNREKHYFASAVTAEGMINYVDEISNNCSKRYIFRGPSGCGKSTIINEIAARAKQRGYMLEFYHCGLETENIIMVIIRNLQLALIDAGHVEITAKPWDIIIDMAACLDNYDQEVVNTQTSEFHRNLETFMLQAQKELGHAGDALKEIKKLNSATMDFQLLNKKREEIREEISRKKD
jgi:GTPase SAR1 family protein